MKVLTRGRILFIVFLLSGQDVAVFQSGSGQKVEHYVLCESKTTSHNCKDSLEAIAANLTEEVDVLLDIEKMYLTLNQNIIFKKLNSLIINGLSDSTSTINCLSSSIESGIIIESIRNLTLNDLTLTLCGSQFTVSGNVYSSALTLRSCSDVNIKNVVITRSLGIGLTIYNHRGGKVYIARSNFTENDHALKSGINEVRSGGGVYIGYFIRDSNHSVAIEFEQCHFARNIVHTKEYKAFYTDEFGRGKSGYGQGGGALVELKDDIHGDVNILFSYCTFTENEAFLGGGLAIQIGRGTRFKLMIKTVVITVQNSIFTSNGCGNDRYTRLGGGVHLNYNFKISSTVSGMEYNFHNVNFTKNCAELGGGVFIHSNRLTLSVNSLVFDSCRFEGNKAHTGSAVDLFPGNYVTVSDGYTIVPAFRNCSFLGNIVTDSIHDSESENAQRTAGVGTLYATQYDVKFEGENCFQHNNGTALHIVNGIANFFNSDAFFYGNHGMKGGAIALIGTSIMVVGPEKVYVFANNSAVHQGGAIFVLTINTHDFTVSRSCFIQFFDGTEYVLTKYWNNSITFSGNIAPVGTAIFATSLHPCQTINTASGGSTPFYVTVNASETFLFRGIDIDDSMVATEGAQLQYQHDTLHIIPGKPYCHSVTIKDDMDNEVKEPLRATISDNDTLAWINSDISSYVEEKIQLKGSEHGRANLSLQTVSSRQIYISFQVQLEECPPGFKLGNKYECECNFREYYGLLKCDNDFFSFLTPGLWAGKVKDETRNESELVTSVCPRNFCTYNNSLTNTQNEIKLP